MAVHQIEITPHARLDLAWYSAFEQKRIVTGIRGQLTHEPLVETRNRKPLRENPIAPWELRIGKYRAFYEVDESRSLVIVVAIGHKEHNVLWIRGKEVQL